jgi:hypothetical protein
LLELADVCVIARGQGKGAHRKTNRNLNAEPRLILRVLFAAVEVRD